MAGAPMTPVVAVEMSPQGRVIYDQLFTLSQFSSSSEYSVVDGGGASMVCLHRSIQATCMPTRLHIYARALAPSMPSVTMGIRPYSTYAHCQESLSL